MVRAEQARRVARSAFGLPPSPPRDGGVSCDRCFRACSPVQGGYGYCGVRASGPEGRIVGGDDEAPVYWYHDPLPTNCVSDWVCAAGSASGVGRSTVQGQRPANLAVFAYGCTFDCMYCQNLSCREVVKDAPAAAQADLAGAIDVRTACVCFFGGDPTPQLPFALAAVERAGKKHKFHVCFETNGAMSPELLDAMINVCLRTHGTIKFDLKAWHPTLHRILTGATRQRVFGNLRRLVSRAAERNEPPLATVSTCLVPGYIDVEEVSWIASAVAALDPDTPYSLLAFHPQYLLGDLPTTSRAQAEDCREAAQKAGLRRVRIGNLHLLR